MSAIDLIDKNEKSRYLSGFFLFQYLKEIIIS